MSRCIGILTICICITFSTAAFGDEGTDVEAIKKLIYRYEDGVFSGDAQKIISCFAPDCVSYSPFPDSLALFMTRGDHHVVFDPESWNVWGVGMDAVREHAKSMSYYPAYLQKHPDYLHTTKVSHVSVNDERGLAVSRHIRRWPIEETRDNVYSEFCSVWLLAKIRGEWKVTGLIAHISGGQLVTKMRPQR